MKHTLINKDGTQTQYADRIAIYESFENGQKEQAYNLACDYGMHLFIQQTRGDMIEGFYDVEHIFRTLRGIMLIASIRGDKLGSN